MTGWLASVADEAEIAQLLPASPDILDLKDPAAGALGAWPVERIAAAVRSMATGRGATGRGANGMAANGMAANGPARPQLSATIGDHPMDPEVVVPAARRISRTGVDIVKIGIAVEGAPERCIDALAPLAADGVRLVAVFFADQWPTDPTCLPIDRTAAAGFAGVMLDTAGKRHGLRHHWHGGQLAGFVACARSFGLLTGLAGSLRLADIPALQALSPDYLGFRGALCGGDRTATIDPQAVAQVAACMARRRHRAVDGGPPVP